METGDDEELKNEVEHMKWAAYSNNNRSDENKQKWTEDQKDAEPFLFVQHPFLFDSEQTREDAELAIKDAEQE